MSELVDLAAEAGLLSGCIIDPSILDNEIKPEWFVSGDNRRIFSAMRALVGRAEPLDAVSLMSELQRVGWDRARATQAALGLTERVPPNPGSLLARLRLLGEARALSECAALGLAHAGRLEIDQAREQLSLVVMGGSSGVAPILTGRELMESAAQAWYEISEETRLEAEGKPPKFIRLNMGRAAETVRCGPGELVTIAAATGVGKSSLAITCALELEARGIRSGLVSVEDGRADWGSKLLGHVAKVRTAGFWQGAGSPDEWQRAAKAVGARDRDEIRLIHAQSSQVDEVCGAMGRLARAGCRAIFVDYIQAITAPGLKGVTRRDAIDYVLGRLMVAARVLGVPLVLMSQLSRPEKTKRFPEPQLSDLKESGTLENSSHGVVMMWITTDDVADGDFGIVYAKVAKTKRDARGTRWAMRRGAGQVLEHTEDHQLVQGI